MNDTVTGAGFYDLVYKLSNDIVKETALRNTRKVKYQFSEMEYLKNMEKVYIDITKNNRGGVTPTNWGVTVYVDHSTEMAVAA